MGHVGHTGTEKKNPFVMTIGFDKNDPEHVEVAEFLNSLPRKKAQYIVEAVRCYRQVQRGSSAWGEGNRGEGNYGERNQGEDNGREGYRGERNAGKPLDKEAIRQIVLQILAERADDKERVAQKSISQPAIHERTKFPTDAQDTDVDTASGEGTATYADTAPDIEPDAAAGIMDGLDQSDLEVIFGSLEALRE